jgi:hypothetical protein
MNTLHSVRVTFVAGAQRTQAARDLVRLAALFDCTAAGAFNEIDMVASKGQTADSVENLHISASNARARDLERRTQESRLERIERKLERLGRLMGDDEVLGHDHAGPILDNCAECGRTYLAAIHSTTRHTRDGVVYGGPYPASTKGPDEHR